MGGVGNFIHDETVVEVLQYPVFPGPTFPPRSSTSSCNVYLQRAADIQKSNR
jgi:hypothetical protein